MPRTACATTATATSLNPCTISAPVPPAARSTPQAASSITSAEGMMKPSQAGVPARQSATQRADGEADLAARRPGQELRRRHEAGIGRLGHPSAVGDEFLPRLPAAVTASPDILDTMVRQNALDFSSQ